MPSVVSIEDPAAWDKLATAWSALFDVSSTASTPLQFDWLRTWWRVYMSGANREERTRLRLFTCWRDAALVGVLPLYVSGGSARSVTPQRLRFVSTGEDEREETCPDYLNILAAPGEEAVCLRAIETALLRERWDALELLDVPDGSALLASSLG